MENHFFKSLEIENFRGIKSAKIKDFARINCFVGDNGCGKTTVLESLFLLCGGIISRPISMIDLYNLKNLIVLEGDQFADIFFERLHEKGLYLVADKESGKRTLRINPVYGGPPSLDQESARTSSVSGIEGDGNKQTSIESSTGNYLLGLEYKLSVSDNGNEMPREYNSKIIGRFNPPHHPDFTQETDDKYNETLSSVIHQAGNSVYDPYSIDRMIEEKRKNVLLQSLSSVENKIRDIKVSPTKIVSADIGYDKFIPINLLGNGVCQVLDIIPKISGITGKRNNILMIDEIGNGLHVSHVEHLWKFLIEQSEKFGTQIFMTTHSKDIIEALSRFYEKEHSLFSEDEHAVACFHLSKNAENHVKGFRYSPSQLMQVLKSDTDIR